MDNLAPRSIAGNILKPLVPFLEWFVEWFLVILVIGILSTLAILVLGDLIQAVKGCIGCYKARKSKKSADVELASQADTGDDTTLHGTPGTSIHGV